MSITARIVDRIRERFQDILDRDDATRTKASTKLSVASVASASTMVVLMMFAARMGMFGASAGITWLTTTYMVVTAISMVSTIVLIPLTVAYKIDGD